MQSNFSKAKRPHGFTIVELLIVIVVIAILAAITVVAFSGMQKRGKTTAAASAAKIVIGKAEAANAAGIIAGYPTSSAGFTAANGKEPDMSGTGITLAPVDAGTPPPKNAVVSYAPCNAPASSVSAGARVTYYNYTNDTVVVKDIGAACTGWTVPLIKLY